ncbi:MAG TPA: FecR family protein [Bryobacteraceae bacterium]|nr:FecR family protein [Bryobacteraceae bacterium]
MIWNLTKGTFAFAAALFVCPVYAQLPNLFPEDKQYAAQVLQMTGQVSLLKGREPWVLNVGDWVQKRQTIVTGPNSYALFQVNDGSTFEVFANSQFVFRNNAGDWKDLLDLYLGRVKVHVQKFGGQPNPNRVTTPTAVISVRGTVFDVQIEDADATTLVLVEEGLVSVRHALIPSSTPKMLSQGEYLRVYKTQPLAKSVIDKGSVLRRALQAASDAASAAIYRMPRGGTGGSTPAPGGGGVPGDTGAPAPPPAPPPPPPPPPPPQ